MLHYIKAVRIFVLQIRWGYKEEKFTHMGQMDVLKYDLLHPLQNFSGPQNVDFNLLLFDFFIYLTQ